MTEPDISEVLAGALLENDQLRARVAELEAELVAQWKWDDGSILRKRRIEKLIPAETLNA